MSASSQSYVYFMSGMSDIGSIKIGTTNNLKRRLSGISCGSAEKQKVLAAIPGDRKIEKNLHNVFSSSRVRTTGEWFYRSNELLQLIKDINEGNPNTILDLEIIKKAKRIQEDKQHWQFVLDAIDSEISIFRRKSEDTKQYRESIYTSITPSEYPNGGYVEYLGYMFSTIDFGFHAHHCCECNDSEVDNMRKQEEKCIAAGKPFDPDDDGYGYDICKDCSNVLDKRHGKSNSYYDDKVEMILCALKHFRSKVKKELDRVL